MFATGVGFGFLGGVRFLVWVWEFLCFMLFGWFGCGFTGALGFGFAVGLV